MSALIALLLLVAAGWFVSSMAGGPTIGRREPVDSVSDFARAMAALDPTGPRPVPGAQPAARPAQSAQR